MIRRLQRGEGDYPGVLGDRLGDAAPSCLETMGDVAILGHRLLGLACSIQCPGDVVIKTLDAIRELRDAGVAMIGGFHSPMEKECLDFLLRGGQPVVFCAARGLRGLPLGAKTRRGILEGRLLLISPFQETIKRTTAAQALFRNEVVAALATLLLTPHASPGGRLWTMISAMAGSGRPVCTLHAPDNAHLIRAGVVPMTVADMVRELGPAARPAQGVDMTNAEKRRATGGSP